MTTHIPHPAPKPGTPGDDTVGPHSTAPHSTDTHTDRGPRGRAARRPRRPPVGAVLVAAGVAVAVGFVGDPATSSAASSPGLGPSGVSVELVALATSVDQVLTNVRNWLMGILAGLATLAATWGGVRYVMAGGDLGEVEKAKSALRSAALGFMLAALAPLVVSILQGLVTA